MLQGVAMQQHLHVDTTFYWFQVIYASGPIWPKDQNRPETASYYNLYLLYFLLRHLSVFSVISSAPSIEYTPLILHFVNKR